MFHGLLIKESLRDLGILDSLKITKEETWDIDDASPGQPKVWHVAWFEIADDVIDETVEKLSQSIDDGKWYLDASDDLTMYIVYQHKVFKYQKGDLAGRKTVKDYGRSLGISEQQLDWKE